MTTEDKAGPADEGRRSSEELGPEVADAYLVEWQCDGQTWVEAHASYTPAKDQADRNQGTVTDLYRGGRAAQDDAYVCGRNDEREAIARWLEGQGQPGYAHEVRHRPGPNVGGEA